MQGLPYIAGFTIAGLWCLPNLLFECVVCDGVYVVLWYVGSRTSREIYAKVSCFCALLMVYELQHDLQMVLSCAGFGDTWKKISCKLRLVAAGAAQQEIWVKPRPNAAYLEFVHLRDFTKDSMSQYSLSVCRSYWKWLEWACKLCGWVSENQGDSFKQVY